MSFDNAHDREKLENIMKKFDEFTNGKTNKTYGRNPTPANKKTTSTRKKAYAKQVHRDFEHTPSSPYNSKANGKAESAVKTAKSLLRKALDSGKDPYMAILDYRNTPTQGMDSSPVQGLMNRCTKTLLSTSRTLLHPKVMYPEKDQQNLAKRQEQQVRYFNQGARDLRELAEDNVVRMKTF
ncbi:hypothetical protein ACROYT_G015483 [Oculina patagonica]